MMELGKVLLSRTGKFRVTKTNKPKVKLREELRKSRWTDKKSLGCILGIIEHDYNYIPQESFLKLSLCLRLACPKVIRSAMLILLAQTKGVGQACSYS
jgi:hypothetical protein